jgi:RNA polymerase sigma-70 factor (ECF subfamily)
MPRAAGLRVTARHKAIDRLRRERGRAGREAEGMQLLSGADDPIAAHDDMLRLLFTCCHPALSPEARIALCLRTVCGLSTHEIATACLVPDATAGQRIHRAKRKIARARIPYRVPEAADLPERLSTVLSVLYLVFTAGHDPATGPVDARLDLAVEAIRVTLDLAALMPGEPDVLGLLALLLATHARSGARKGTDGDAQSLAEQDRGRWDHDAIAEAARLVHEALRLGPAGPHTLEAAIACLHGQAASYAETDWSQIVALYRLLEQAHPTAVVRVNRAVAEAERGDPAAGLALLDDVDSLGHWPYYWAARGHCLRGLRRIDEARRAYARALACDPGESDRRFFAARLEELPPRTVD